MMYLKVLSSDSQEFTGKELPLVGDEITIGRQSDCTILVPDAAVSRKHAKILRTPEGLLLVDDGGRNGLFVNGERVTHRLLEDGDVIRVGHTDMALAGKVPARAAWSKEAGPAPLIPPLQERLEQTTMLEPIGQAPEKSMPEKPAGPRPRPRVTLPPEADQSSCPVCAAPVADGARRCEQCGALAALPRELAPPRSVGATSASRAIAALGLLTAGVLLVVSVLLARDHGLIGHDAEAAVQAQPAKSGPHTRVP